MIEAIFGAVPALFPVLAVLGLLFGAVAFWQARRHQYPPAVPILWALSLAGELTATLTPGGGSTGSPSCSIGAGVWDTAVTEQGLMNIALYVPLALFGTIVFRRPLTILATSAVLSGVTEVLQTLMGLGRACDGADFVDNVCGALVGTALAVLWLWLRRRKPQFGCKDALHSFAAAGTGFAAVAVVIWMFIPLYHDESGFGTNSSDDGGVGASRRIAVKLFGPDTQVQTTQMGPNPEKSSQRVLDVTTDRGQFRIEWPTERLLLSASANSQVDPGSLTQDQVLKVGADFATTWFSDLTPAATRTLTPTDSAGGAYMLTYRRYNSDAVLMPMRLDITVSTSGRIMASSARWDTDPQLPHPTVSADAAKAKAVSTVPGSRADTTFLLAKQIDGQWRPCWAVNLIKQGEAQRSGTVDFVDAITGQSVAHQG
ncbi:VanZ family protein [Kitasatospora phosalacinea]|uniref:VanZ family protein n=1 Tax=Kitasatospora phosalacinea TaxID=2065 RepID=UPI00068FAD07|nr:VanZ family protein [Kitasatospora phosalacinea]